MQSGGEEEQDEEAHTPLPPPMEIIKDPSAQDEKVGLGRWPALAALLPSSASPQLLSHLVSHFL